MKRVLITIFIVCGLFGPVVSNARALEDTMEAKVERVVSQEGSYQELELTITSGSLKDTKITVEHGDLPEANTVKYETGDKVVLTRGQNMEGEDVYFVSDYVRRESLGWLFAVFVILTVIIARWRGVMSLAGMAISFGVIFAFILPRISGGASPVTTAILGSIIIIPVTFYFSHGLNRKTSVAVAGTLIALVFTGFLAGWMVDAAKLTGFASEEAGFLQVAAGGTINIKGLLLAGIIIGVLGVLDDITVSQSAIVFQLKEANPKMKSEELFRRAMNVGQDHIASMVNTLVLVYTGASLPLLLLFIDTPLPFSQVINYEIIADEIVRTLVGSIGLITAVPITTLIASWAVNRNNE